MQIHTDDEFDVDAPDAEERALAERRMKAYSADAFKAGLGIDRVFINYDQFKGGLAALDLLFQKGGQFQTPYGMRLIGPTGAGKTTLFRYFRDSLPRSTLFNPTLAAIGARLPAKPSGGSIVRPLLKVYRYPFKSATNSELYARAEILKDLIREKETRLLFVDEAHHLFAAVAPKHPDREPPATVILRELMDETNVALVLAGDDRLLELEGLDRHLADRVNAVHFLDYFKECDAKWVGLIKGYVKQAKTFDISFLLCEGEPQRLHLATGGNLRRLKRLITEAVMIAVDLQQLTLDATVLCRAVNILRGANGISANPYVTSAALPASA